MDLGWTCDDSLTTLATDRAEFQTRDSLPEDKGSGKWRHCTIDPNHHYKKKTGMQNCDGL